MSTTTSNRRRPFFFGLIIPLGLAVLILAREVIWPFVAAFFLAFAINPVVDFFQRKGARRDWAILTVYLVLTVLVILCFQLLIPLLVNDITEILQRLPVIFKELETGGDRLIRSLDSWPLPFNPRALITDLGRRGESILRQTL
ncbi:MAG TPA: AI-2E family transporter, partial [Bacillota bacterium]